MCARIGLVTGSGLAFVINKKYSKKVVFPIISLLLIANTINIGADIAAMAASIMLVFPQSPMIVATLSYSIYTSFRNYSALQKVCKVTKISYSVLVCICGNCSNCRW